MVRACTIILNGQKLEPAERKRILILRGVGWSKEDEFTAAAEDFSSAIEIDPANVAALEGRAKAHNKLAEHSKSAADHSKAAIDWSQLIALQPQNDKYYRLRGIDHLGAGLHQQALADFDKSLEINPKAVDAYIAENALVIPLIQYVQPILAAPGVTVTPHASGALLPHLMKRS